MSRISQRNQVIVSGSNDGRKVLYIMHKAFRIRNNYTLFQAYEYAKKHECELFIILIEPYESNERNLEFFYQFSDDLIDKLGDFSDHVSLVKRDESLEEHINDVHTIFIDKSYLKFDIDILKTLKDMAYDQDMILIEVEVNVFVPVVVASDKEEYAARTIRPKINHQLDDFEHEVLTDASISKAEEEAMDQLQLFIDERLEHYDDHNDPSLDLTSGLSPYLKYGFISPVTIYHKVQPIDSQQKEDFIEELIVRRELAYNFVYYNKGYDDFESMTEKWAYQTMKKHLEDQREYLYTKEDYLKFNTHDPYFNAAMMEMVFLGKMHSYMRMYWCKKIIEWSKTYRQAYDIALSLNNHYFYDGLTPNSYTGVAWCFGKHDRAWTERDIFGKLRYMNDKGLKRKFNIEDYVEQMKQVKEDNQ